MSKVTKWFIYDGRYWTDPDRAIVMSVCDTKEEAEEEKYDYGNDCVVVEEQINE
jgi:hypothetical protein